MPPYGLTLITLGRTLAELSRRLLSVETAFNDRETSFNERELSIVAAQERNLQLNRRIDCKVARRK